jgi:hypothetical protein
MNIIRSINRSVLLLVLCAIAIAFTPALRAEIPPDQVKAASDITLTTALLDKMDKFISAVGADAAAKAELAELDKDPAVSKDQDAWGAAITTKCPKVSGHLKDAGLTAPDFTKGITAIMACAMSEEMTKSDNATAKANAEFVAANKERAEKTFGSFMELSMPKP